MSFARPSGLLLCGNFLECYLRSYSHGFAALGLSICGHTVSFRIVLLGLGLVPDELLHGQVGGLAFAGSRRVGGLQGLGCCLPEFKFLIVHAAGISVLMSR
jgi:hypothetical protein